jgi:hypothetical protein
MNRENASSGCCDAAAGAVTTADAFAVPPCGGWQPRIAAMVEAAEKKKIAFKVVPPSAPPDTER